MKRLFKVFTEILGVIFASNPFVVIFVFVSAILTGVISPIFVWVNSLIFDRGIMVASGELSFHLYIPYLILFIVLALLPVIIGDVLIRSYIWPRCQLILRTAYKSKMLKKMKKLRYEHLENEESIEIIDKAFNRVEDVVLALFPSAVWQIVSSGITSIGILFLFASVRWWLLPIILLPFALETWLLLKFNNDVYTEMETYWGKEHSYSLLGGMLHSRHLIKENHLFGISNYLIGIYQKRLNNRNQEFESFFFKHFRRNFFKQNITKLVQIGCSIVLLLLYIKSNLSIGLLISLTITIFTGLFNALNSFVHIVRNSGQHIINMDYIDKYFALSEDEYGDTDIIPSDCSIEFDNVHFTYPGSDKKIFEGLSLKINHGEKVSIVGANGEGKTTMIKLLLGLFQPDSGEIRIGGKPLSCYTPDVRNRLFGPVFQDFVRYSIPLNENIGVGDIDNINDTEAVDTAMHKAKVDAFADMLAEGKDTLLGREFEGGVDLSGGQWQRIAIARAFMGNKPILILDEPTGQLDPMAESRIYSEFAEISNGKTAIFITHRLASTMITDHICVIAGGRIMQSGTHDELIEQGGLYADMYNAQKQWYVKSDEVIKNA
jgi:ATP-binding cassette subfamily B protein